MMQACLFIYNVLGYVNTKENPDSLEDGSFSYQNMIKVNLLSFY